MLVSCNSEVGITFPSTTQHILVCLLLAEATAPSRPRSSTNDIVKYLHMYIIRIVYLLHYSSYFTFHFPLRCDPRSGHQLAEKGCWQQGQQGWKRAKQLSESEEESGFDFWETGFGQSLGEQTGGSLEHPELSVETRGEVR
jgi:hypothetical protein